MRSEATDLTSGFHTGLSNKLLRRVLYSGVGVEKSAIVRVAAKASRNREHRRTGFCQVTGHRYLPNQASPCPKGGVGDLIRRRHDLEKVILSRAVRRHLQRRILVHDNKTVVFA